MCRPVGIVATAKAKHQPGGEASVRLRRLKLEDAGVQIGTGKSIAAEEFDSGCFLSG